MKYEFGGPEWRAALHGMLAHVAHLYGDQPGFKISVCEVFYNAPPHLAGENGAIAWTLTSDGASAIFDFAERDDVDFKVRADYAFALLASRLDTDDPAQEAELAALRDRAIAAGQIEIVRGASEAGASPIHNLMARITA